MLSQPLFQLARDSLRRLCRRLEADVEHAGPQGVRIALALRSSPPACGRRSRLTLPSLTTHRKTAEAAQAARRGILTGRAVLSAGGVLAGALPGLAAAHHAAIALLKRHAQLASAEEPLGLPRRDQRQRLGLADVGAKRLDVSAGSAAPLAAALTSAAPAKSAASTPATAAKTLRKDLAGAQANRQARKKHAEHGLGHRLASLG